MAYVELKKITMREYTRTGNFGVAVNDAPRNAQKTDGVKKIYATWHNMLRRCYDPAHTSLFPSYQGCRVCEEWLTYSNFEKWYKEHYREGYELDKDIIAKGNKVYSPDTCEFVPKYINYLCLRSQGSRGKYPIGVTFKQDKKKYKAYMLIKHKQQHIGYFDSPEEAFAAYKEKKEAYIKSVASTAFANGEIGQNIYQALMNYNIELTD